jgi:hypothetical protein
MDGDARPVTVSWQVREVPICMVYREAEPFSLYDSVLAAVILAE